jgi:CubicO group peptidase (beta-lactamase class C family)
VRHLLAHASGLAWDSPKPLGRPGERRVYSNTGYVVLADHVATRSAMPFADYLAEAVLRPLGLAATLEGDAAGGMVGTVGDLLAFGREALAPTLVAPETLAEMTSVQFPGLYGVLPDYGRVDPLDWGLGVQLATPRPTWMGSRVSRRAFGHFGGSGTFLWVDPEAGVACAVLTNRPFGEWAKEAWPELSDAVLEELG